MPIDFANLAPDHAARLTQHLSDIQEAISAVQAFEDLHPLVFSIERRLNARKDDDHEVIRDHHDSLSSPPNEAPGASASSNLQGAHQIANQKWWFGDQPAPVMDWKGIAKVLTESHEANCRLVDMHKEAQSPIYWEHGCLTSAVDRAVDRLVGELLA